MAEMTHRLECANGIILVARDGCIHIFTKRQEEQIPCAAIKTVTVKEPGISYGKITFMVDQQNSMGVNIGFGVIAALGAERSFLYKKDDYWLAEKMRDYILECQKPKPVVVQQTVVQTATTPSSTDAFDQIRKLKSLLDDGILTQEEFDAKKKQLLGL